MSKIALDAEAARNDAPFPIEEMKTKDAPFPIGEKKSD